MHLVHCRQPSTGKVPLMQARRHPGVEAKCQRHLVCHRAAGAARSLSRPCTTRRPSCSTESYRDERALSPGAHNPTGTLATRHLETREEWPGEAPVYRSTHARPTGTLADRRQEEGNVPSRYELRSPPVNSLRSGPSTRGAQRTIEIRIMRRPSGPRLPVRQRAFEVPIAANTAPHR